MKTNKEIRMDEIKNFPNLPDRIRGLGDLAYNLWWSWHPQARELFRSLNLQAWRESNHNPVRLLSLLTEDIYAKAVSDHDFLSHYDAVMDQFAAETDSPSGWFTAEFGHLQSPLAYFSAEYGLHVSLPVYAGGLGILAGDYIKECSDLAIPLVAVGLIYSEGYVVQKIREDGWQEDVEANLDRSYDPIVPVLDANGAQITVQVPLFEPPVHVAIWKVNVGRVPLYLMDTDLEINQPWDRAIAQRLYAGNPEQRLRQEIVLGMGGMRVLEKLGIELGALHINEGHPALGIFERIRKRTQDGMNFADALQQVRKSTLFTTHTPVSAGTDVFPFQLMDKYFSKYYDDLAVDRDAFMQLGMNPQDPNAGFNMTVFALRSAGFSNAVSQRHGQVARKMWAGLWPEKKEDEVPILSITNGVHLPSWIAPLKIQPLLDRYLGSAWSMDQERMGVWEPVEDIPDKELWDVHQDLKMSLIDQIDKRARRRWYTDKVATSNVVALGALLDREVLTLGFARRFTGYKRPDLILHDLDRFKRLVSDPLHPVQIIFAGKAHPADMDGKRLIQKIFQLAKDPAFFGRIAFVEDYDQQLAEYLVHGVDVWLNNPIPPLEASGTSGMKASINGVPTLSILDGWWIEGYQEGNGWAFGAEMIEGDRSQVDAESIYEILEKKIIPTYYQRSDDGVPHAFVKVMKSAIESVAPHFSTRRMAKEYVSKCYLEMLGLPEDHEVGR
jgi:starch phosphorylase